MLDSLTVKNFRSCQNVELRLGEPVIALVGKNGVGKTNVLHALQLTSDLCIGDVDSLFRLHPRDRKQPTELGLTFGVAGSSYAYQMTRTMPSLRVEVFRESLFRGKELLFERDGEEIRAPRAGLPEGTRIGTRSSSLAALMQILPKDSSALDDLRPVEEYLRAVRYLPLLQGFQEHAVSQSARGEAYGDSTPYIEMSKYDAWKADLAQGRPRRSVQFRLLHLFLTDTPRFNELKTLLGEQGLGLISDIQVRSVNIPKSTKDSAEDAVEPAYAILYMPGGELAGSRLWFRYSGLSAGTSRILQLLTYLIYDHNSCLLVEQPEDCIHPGLLAKVIDILRTYSSQTQLVCTTHSPRVMNVIGARGIRFVTAIDGQTSIHELSGEELLSAKRYLEDDGTLAEFIETL